MVASIRPGSKLAKEAVIAKDGEALDVVFNLLPQACEYGMSAWIVMFVRQYVDAFHSTLATRGAGAASEDEVL